MIPGIQATFSTATIDYFKIITLLGYGAAGVVFVILALNFSTRDKALYLLFVQVVESLYNQWVKMLYRSPRPYLVSDEMQIFGTCAMTYGNPSGHASFSASFYTTCFLLIFHDEDSTLK